MSKSLFSNIHDMWATFNASVTTAARFAAPFLAYHLAGSVKPALAGYKITHRCNLKCAHCPYWKRVGDELDFPGVLRVLERLAAMGARILILEGGEPLLWRDGKRTIEHVVDAARQLFPAVCMTTNGTLPWSHLPLDATWISMDGPPQTHDRIRGKDVFARMWANVTQAGRDRLFASTTVSTQNRDSIPELVAMLQGVVEGITIQFYYPYHGLPDPLFIPAADRDGILKELIQLKRSGYPVANSFRSLKELRREGWTCEDRLLANAEPDGSIAHGCYLKNRAESNCLLCGFSAHNEMSLAFKGCLEAVRTGRRIFFPGPARQIFPNRGKKCNI
jgi:Fe-coproporphyrin III synthase